MLFCHAGVDEEAWDDWEIGRPDYYYIGKHSPTTGKFVINIVDGHIAASTVAENKKHKGIYYDGESHYFIDGDTERTEQVLILMYDTEKKKFYEVSNYGDKKL